MRALGAPPVIRTAVKVRRVSDAIARIVIAGASRSVRSVSTARLTDGTRCCAGAPTPVPAHMCRAVSGRNVDSQAAQSGQEGWLFVHDATRRPVMAGWIVHTKTYSPRASGGTEYQRVAGPVT